MYCETKKKIRALQFASNINYFSHHCDGFISSFIKQYDVVSYRMMMLQTQLIATEKIDEKGRAREREREREKGGVP